MACTMSHILDLVLVSSIVEKFVCALLLACSRSLSKEQINSGSVVLQGRLLYHSSNGKDECEWQTSNSLMLCRCRRAELRL